MKLTVEFDFPDNFSPTTDEFIMGVMMSPILFKDVKYRVINRVGPEALTFDSVEKTVCNFVGCTISEMQNPSRKGNGIIARRLCHHISVNLHLGPLAKIGDRFGNKDHATVLNSNRKVIEFLRMDILFKQQFQTFIESFKNGNTNPNLAKN